jgi:hypothetical protein
MSTSATPFADAAPRNPAAPVSSGLPTGGNDGPPNDGGTGNELGWLACALFGCYLIVLLIALVYVLLIIWPEKQTVDSAKFLGKWAFNLPPERRYILVVIVAGALGSFVHLATSFADFVGNRRLVRSWMWWYALRPFIGIALALLFYFVFRGGLMTTSSNTSELSVFGIAAMSGLAGMFSKQVTDKLREICDTAFSAVKSAPPRSDGIADQSEKNADAGTGKEDKADAAGAGK